MDAATDLCEECKWWELNGYGSQRICETCSLRDDTLPVNNFPEDDNNDITFPDDAEPGEVNDVFANAIPWREVEQKLWLCVEYLIDVNTQFGPARIVGLQKRDGETIKACTTPIIGTALTKKEKNKESKNVFIRSMGKTLSKNKKISYYNFQLKLF